MLVLGSKCRFLLSMDMMWLTLPCFVLDSLERRCAVSDTVDASICQDMGSVSDIIGHAQRAPSVS